MALPRRMKPGSEYSVRAPGLASSGSCRVARRSASGVAQVRKKLDVAGQAGTVREQHAEGDALFAAAGLHADDKAGEDVAEAGVEVETAARVEEHGSGGGGDDFGEAGEIEDGGGLDGGAQFVRT